MDSRPMIRSSNHTNNHPMGNPHPLTAASSKLVTNPMDSRLHPNNLVGIHLMDSRRHINSLVGIHLMDNSQDISTSNMDNSHMDRHSYSTSESACGFSPCLSTRLLSEWSPVSSVFSFATRQVSQE